MLSTSLHNHRRAINTSESMRSVWCECIVVHWAEDLYFSAIVTNTIAFNHFKLHSTANHKEGLHLNFMHVKTRLISRIQCKYLHAILIIIPEPLLRTPNLFYKLTH